MINLMLRLAVIFLCAVLGFLLYRRGNSIYSQLETGGALSRSQAWAIGLNGLSAAIFFVGLILLMSIDDQGFSWTAPELGAMLAVSAIVGLVVSGITAAKIYAFRRYGKRLFVMAGSRDDPDGPGDDLDSDPHNPA